MKTQLSHIQFNVAAPNIGFYRDLLSFLGWIPLYADEMMLGMGGPHHDSLWFSGVVKEVHNDYDGPGMNHLGFGTETQAEVDAAAAYLTEKGVTLLFDTPRHRPEFAESEAHTYYQIMFESPDRILFEIVYMGLKS